MRVIAEREIATQKIERDRVREKERDVEREKRV